MSPSHGSAGHAHKGAEFQPPAPYDPETVYQAVKTACAGEAFSCYEEAFRDLMEKHGPRAALDAFTMLRQRGDLEVTTDGHHVAHHLGHHTSMVFGPSAKALALCPKSYNYGCIHGFFQHALGQKKTTPEAAAGLCRTVEDDPAASQKDKAYCYHGYGHGVMMYEGHHLRNALQACDLLDTTLAQNGCWQGVFMENINVAGERRFEKSLLSPSEPLAPCNELEPKYRGECFVNHAGWLMSFYERDVVKATHACLKAPDDGSIAVCLAGIGLMATNPAWQKDILKEEATGTLLENAWLLCQKFPDAHVDTCITSALDNVMNHHVLDLTLPATFCAIVDERYRVECHQRIGLNLGRMTASTQQAQELCETLQKDTQQSCLSGIPF